MVGDESQTHVHALEDLSGLGEDSSVGLVPGAVLEMGYRCESDLPVHHISSQYNT